MYIHVYIYTHIYTHIYNQFSGFGDSSEFRNAGCRNVAWGAAALLGLHLRSISLSALLLLGSTVATGVLLVHGVSFE